MIDSCWKHTIQLVSFPACRRVLHPGLLLMGRAAPRMAAATKRCVSEWVSVRPVVTVLVKRYISAVHLPLTIFFLSPGLLRAALHPSAAGLRVENSDLRCSRWPVAVLQLQIRACRRRTSHPQTAATRPSSHLSCFSFSSRVF